MFKTNHWINTSSWVRLDTNNNNDWCSHWERLYNINTLRPRQNGRHFADDPFKRIFLNETLRISIKISLNFVPKGPINNIPALVQIMAWCRPGDKPLSEPMMVSLLTHICVTRPQWVKIYLYLQVKCHGRQCVISICYYQRTSNIFEKCFCVFTCPSIFLLPQNNKYAYDSCSGILCIGQTIVGVPKYFRVIYLTRVIMLTNIDKYSLCIPRNREYRHSETPIKPSTYFWVYIVHFVRYKFVARD